MKGAYLTSFLFTEKSCAKSCARRYRDQKSITARTFKRTVRADNVHTPVWVVVVREVEDPIHE